MNLTKWMIALALGVAVLAGCDGAGSGGDRFPIAPVNPQAKGDRLFGINMSEGTQGFDGAYADLKAAGAQVIELNIPWNAFYVGGATSGGLQDPWEGILAATG